MQEDPFNNLKSINLPLPVSLVLFKAIPSDLERSLSTWNAMFFFPVLTAYRRN